MLTNEESTTLKKKYFPRVPWAENGPVRRRYMVCAARDEDAPEALSSLAEREGFTEPGQRTVCGGAAECLAAFRERAAGGPVGMIFGTSPDAHWCDAAFGLPDGEGWRLLIVRSEEGENLVALAHNEGLLRFRRAG